MDYLSLEFSHPFTYKNKTFSTVKDTMLEYDQQMINILIIRILSNKLLTYILFNTDLDKLQVSYHMQDIYKCLKKVLSDSKPSRSKVPKDIWKYKIKPYLEDNSCEGITQNSVKCINSLSYRNTETGNKKDCTIYCFKNIKKWGNKLLDNLPRVGIFLNDEKTDNLEIKYIIFEGTENKDIGPEDEFLITYKNNGTISYTYTNNMGYRTDLNRNEAIRDLYNMIKDKNTYYLGITIIFKTPYLGKFVKFNRKFLNVDWTNKKSNIHNNQLYTEILIKEGYEKHIQELD